MNKHPKYDPDLDDDTTSGGGAADLSSYKINLKKTEEEDEGEGSIGVSGLSVEEIQAWLAALQTKELRKGERKFGQVPDTKDPNELLNRNRQSQGYGSQIKTHPLLSRTQRFSGDDPKLTARASENNKAQEEFVKEQLQNQLRNEYRHTHTHANRARAKPTLTR